MRKKVTLENLAGMVKRGFDSVDKRLANLEQGQEEIKLKLDNVAYRFELIDPVRSLVAGPPWLHH